MSLFSQSLCIGEDTLKELEKEAVTPVIPAKILTPNRSIANNSDNDIIEESPTNVSIFAIRERNKAKHLHKSRSVKKKGKSRSSEQLITTTTTSDCSKNTLSQFFRSEIDFGDEITKILAGNIIDTNKDCEKIKNPHVNDSFNCYESEMFSEWAVPQNVTKPATQIKTQDRKATWEDSYDFNDIDLNLCIEKENAVKDDENFDEQALGVDTVTFTQNVIKYSSVEDDQNLRSAGNSFNTSGFVEEMESSRNSLNAECNNHLSMSEGGQMSKLNFNISESSFTLNYSGSSVDIDEKQVIAPNENDKSELPSLNHMNSIDSWGLPSSIVRQYHRKKIFDMFDWQRSCLSNRKVLLENANLVYCAPTSAGKTLVSEILMIKSVLEKRKKVIIILPFVSVVREKMNYLQDLLTPSGIKVEGYFGGYSPRSFDDVHVAVCTIEKANSIVNKLLEQKKVDSIGCVVVDEVHLISDPNRGYILELLLAKILYVNRRLQCGIQVICMSATLPNLDLLTNWLNAEFYHTDFRPVVLTEMVKINKQIFDNKMQLLRTVSDVDYQELPKDPDNIAQMCVETILENGSVIVFCASKDWCESLANHLAKFIFLIRKSDTDLGAKMRNQINDELIAETKAQLRNCSAGLDALLDRTITFGSAYHHAGLTSDERDIIESAFKGGSIRVIVSTSTLSSGVNLPARRVIIRSPIAFNRLMDPMVYKQMIGRAGRTGKDTVGESVLICDNSNKKSGEDLVSAKLKPLASCLAVDNCLHLIRAILEIIASGMAKDKNDLETFCGCTLLATERQLRFRCTLETDAMKNDDDGSDPIGTCLQFLISKEFVRLQRNDETSENVCIATRLGNACLASSMPPKDALDLFSELQTASQSFVLETDLHAIYLVTPFSICKSIQNIDWLTYFKLMENLPPSMARVAKLVGVTEAFLARAMLGHIDSKKLQIHKRFYAALAFEELVNEKSLNEVARKYSMDRGLLQTLQQQASTFAATVTAFCHALNWTMLAKVISEFKERLFFGVHHDLVDLMKIPNLNGHRARSLFNGGIQTLTDLANSDVLTVEKILYNSICFDSKQRDGEQQWDAEQRNKFRILYVTGKPGLTVRQAAEEIIENARQYRELEMGVGNVVWSAEQPKSQNQNVCQGSHPTTRIETTDSKLPIAESGRKRKLDDHGSNSSDDLARPDSKCRRLFPVYESETESESECELFSDGFAGSNMETEDQIELIESIKYEEFNLVNVFGSLEFFNHFQSTVRKSSVISVSVGVNQLTQSAPIIGLSSLVKQMNNDEESIASYNCAFDDNKFIAGISLCFGDSDVYNLTMQNETSDDVSITFDMKVKFLVELFHLEHMTLVMYDAKEQCKVLLKCFPQLRSFCVRLRDPLVANWLLEPHVYGNLFTMVRKYAPDCRGFTDIAGRASGNRTSISLNCKSTVSPLMRSSVESCASLHIMESQMEHLQKTNSKMASAFTDIEMPIQVVLLTMELVGFPVDDRKISEVASELTDTLRHLEYSMFRINRRNFNIKSKMEVAKVLGLYQQRANNGKISITKRVLEKLNNPIAELLLQHVTVESTLTANIQPLIRQSVNNRIYPRSSCFSKTGRVHLFEPSLQNVTNNFDVSSDSGLKTISCRRVFQASSGCELISADFCQLELRILTHFSNDRRLTQIMHSNSDVFKMIAAEWHNVSEIEITEQQRNNAKQICYGIVYGMGSKSLAEKMHCSEAEAQKQQDLFLKRFAGIGKFTEKVVARARECGYIETISGRRRYLPDITSNGSSRRGSAERQAVNSTIQGSAADVAKEAMLEMDKCIRQKAGAWENVHLVLHIHDELVYEAPKALVNEVVHKLKRSMEKCHELAVPLRVKLKTGRDWGSMGVIDLLER